MPHSANSPKDRNASVSVGTWNSIKSKSDILRLLMIYSEQFMICTYEYYYVPTLDTVLFEAND